MHACVVHVVGSCMQWLGGDQTIATTGEDGYDGELETEDVMFFIKFR